MNREEDVFAGAIDCRSPDEVSDYLNKQCAGDQQLRGRVERLLAAHAGADSLLDPPLNVSAATHDVQPAISERPGDQIGHYKLLQEIGSGGFGVVYMAEQIEPVRRRVALKIIKPGMDTREVIARFEAERQALAMMDHPNIAKVLDAGATASGRPCFVMELVKGVPVTQYCDDNSLPTEERLNLFVQVCNAVQHAHQKGVIHRDLKPSNVMVTLHDGVPVPKVIDFGVSKALSQQLTEKTLFTRYGQIIGTPQYMSPEQAELSGLDVDTRSDIYSLGVLLYELLTGRPPFDSETLRKAGLDEMRRMIREDEPPCPSSRIRTLDADTATHVATHRGSRPERLSRLLRGELDWIVMKALEKNRNRRYETANGLALDITRHLTNEPVAAGPPSTAYQLFKLYQRHRRLATLGGALAAGLLVGLVCSTIGLLWAVNERAAKEKALVAALDAEESERTARIEAESARKQTERALASQREAQSLLLDVIVKVGTNLPSGVLEGPALQRLPPEIENEIRLSLARKLMIEALYADAVTQLRRAHEVSEKAFGKSDSRTITIQRYLGYALGNEEQLEAVLATEKSLLRGPSYRTLALLGRLYLKRGDAGLARQTLEFACERYDPLDTPELWAENPYLQLSRVYEEQGDSKNAERVRNRGIEITFLQYRGKVKTYQDVGATLLERKEFDNAEWCYRIADYLAESDSKQRLANLGNLAKLFRLKGDVTQSKRFAQHGFELSSQTNGGEQAWMLSRQARCHVDVLDLQSAEDLLRQALIVAKEAQPNSDVVQWLQFELGMLLRAMGETREAAELLAEAAATLRERIASNRTSSGVMLGLQMLFHCERFSAEGSPDLSNLKSLVEEIKDATPLPVTELRDELTSTIPLGALCELEGRTSEALEAYRSFALSRDYWDSFYVEYPELRVVAILTSENKHEEARKFLDELLGKADIELPALHPRRAIARQRLAEFLIEQKQEPDRAMKLLEEARDNFKQHAIVPAKRFEEIDALIAQAKALKAK